VEKLWSERKIGTWKGERGVQVKKKKNSNVSTFLKMILITFHKTEKTIGHLKYYYSSYDL